jgi:hypothetical protein
MPDGAAPHAAQSRDTRIDWLRGLAMACVIVNHSKLSSFLSWFSYERFWVVTAAEVFVVLSGIVVGMVYGGRLRTRGWEVVVGGLSRRAVKLYVAYMLVTVSVLMIAALGVDVRTVSSWDERASAWFLDPHRTTAATWRDIMLMRQGLWPFEVVGLYVWLVAAAIPCFLILRAAGCRLLLGASWLLYLGYRVSPFRLTDAEFEVLFPLPAWQLLFVHGIAIGYHRERIAAFSQRLPKAAWIAATCAAAAFAVFASCNPWSNGPSWLHWTLLSPDRFAHIYDRYFRLADLGMGRLANLALTLPLGYALLTRCWSMAQPLQIVFVTLGRRSLEAFVLHVYGILLLANLPHANELWTNTFLQLTLIAAIVILLHNVPGWRADRRRARMEPARPLASQQAA